MPAIASDEAEELQPEEAVFSNNGELEYA